MHQRLHGKSVLPMGSNYKDYEKELGKLQAGVVSNYFSPDEIREIISNLRVARQRLGEQGLASRISLMRDMTMKIEELTQIMVSKSGWDRRFKVGVREPSPQLSSMWSRMRSS